MARRKSQLNQARDNMTSLGLYKPEFEPVLEIYAQLREQYDRLTKQYKKSGYDFEESTAQGTKKAPIVTTLESLRKDILAYAAQLGLTPHGLLKTDDQAFAKPKRSQLAEALKDAEG